LIDEPILMHPDQLVSVKS